MEEGNFEDLCESTVKSEPEDILSLPVEVFVCPENETVDEDEWVSGSSEQLSTDPLATNLKCEIEEASMSIDSSPKTASFATDLLESDIASESYKSGKVEPSNSMVLSEELDLGVCQVDDEIGGTSQKMEVPHNRLRAHSGWSQLRDRLTGAVHAHPMTQTERLIEEVRARPVIWNSTLEVYKDVTKKDRAWEEIAEILLLDKASVRLQWRKLRDNHRQALIRRKTSIGLTATKIRKWKYEDQMQFMVKKVSDTDIPLASEKDVLRPADPSNILRPAEPSVSKLVESVDIPTEQIANSLDQPKDFTTQFQDDSEDDNDTVQESNSSTKKLRGIDKVLAFIKNKEINRRKHLKRLPDEIDLFFASAAQSVRKLPRRLQNKVKMEVLNSINKAEEEIDWKWGTSSDSTQPAHSSICPTL